MTIIDGSAPTALTPAQYNRARSLITAMESAIRAHGLDPDSAIVHETLPKLCVELVSAPRRDIRGEHSSVA